MFSFCFPILRNHRRVLHAYLSLGPRDDPKNVNDTGTLRLTYSAFHKGRARSPIVVGFTRRGCNATLHDWVSRVVAVQQVYRGPPERLHSRGYTGCSDPPVSPKPRGCTGSERTSQGTHLLP